MDKKPVSNLNSFIEDMIPRSSPVAHYIPPINIGSLVPEVSLILPNHQSVDPIIEENSATSLIQSVAQNGDNLQPTFSEELENSIILENDETSNASSEIPSYVPKKRRSNRLIDKIEFLEEKLKELEIARKRDMRQIHALFMFIKNLNYKMIMQEKELGKLRMSTFQMEERIRELEAEDLEDIFPNDFDDTSNKSMESNIQSSSSNSSNEEEDNISMFSKNNSLVEDRRVNDMSQSTLEYMRRHGLINLDLLEPDDTTQPKTKKNSPKNKSGNAAKRENTPGPSNNRNKPSTTNILNVDEIKKQPKFK